MNAEDAADRLIARIPIAIRAALANDPKGVMERHYGLRIQPTRTPPRRGQGGLCDGMSIRSQQLVLYVPTPNSRRQNFTLLHELGHLLFESDEDLLVWAADREHPSRTVEDVCDRVAASLLLPLAVLDQVLGGHRPTASHLVTLYERSQASREVCAIALSRRLGCEGFVAIVDRTESRVSFAARTADTRPYAWRGDLVPVGQPLRTIGLNSAMRREAWWAFPNGDKRAFYLDAISDDKRVYAILAEADLWGIASLHVRDPGERRSSGGFSAPVLCTLCGFEGVTSRFPCPDCHKPYCPKCGKCECYRRAQHEGVCRACREKVPIRRLVNGVCNDCRSQGRT